MLTNIYYYNHYKPYMFSTTGRSQKTLNSRNEYKKNAAISSSKGKSEDFSYFLNTSLKNDIVKYAKGFSDDFNAIRDTSRFLVQQADSRRLSVEERQENVKEGLEDLANQYNDYKEFVDNRRQVSPVLEEYADGLDEKLENNRELFARVGLTRDDEGKLVYDGSVLDEMDKAEFMKNLGEIRNVSSAIYDDTIKAMQTPMSQNMNFKGLDYYYNYMYAKVDTRNSYRMIETGMLVDIEV
ncbi:MAG: hypothetical protein IJ583_04585 [Firmicutes bacterium]|nr:hypothetical protein [Bacillota bacterium]